MTRLTNEELMTALQRQDFETLWRASDPWVKFAMQELHCGDEDAFQTGRLAAGEAVRTWCPAAIAFSTHICRYVRGAILNWMNEQGTGGIGSMRQAAEGNPVEVTSLNDPAESASRDDEDDGEARATHLDRLTYEQSDDRSEFERWLTMIEPSAEMDRLLTRIPTDDSKFFREVMRAGGIRAFSRATGVAAMTVSRSTQKIVAELAVQQQKSSVIRGKGYDPGLSNDGYYINDPVGNPYADWSYKPTETDLAAGSAPRDGARFSWSAGARKILRLPPKESR